MGGPRPERWLDEVWSAAEARLPAHVWRYFVAGAGDEVSAGEAEERWRSVRFRPRVLRDVREVDTSATLLGSSYRLPVGIAPTSLQRAADPRGELAMAGAAGAAGVPHVVSSNAGHAFADIAAVGAPWWVQAYVTEARDDCLPMLEAAVAAGAGAVVLTVDTPFAGPKRDLPEDAFDAEDLAGHRVNYDARVCEERAGRWAHDLGPEDLEWLADRTGLPVVVKGVLHPDDARICVEAGARAVWVSNHGGRQLDRAVATADALPHVTAAVGTAAQVYVDGGIRSGLDVLAALALGADAVFLGRTPLLALAAGGEEAVARALALLGHELVEGMRLAGVRTLREAPEALSAGLWPGSRRSDLTLP
jgi:4-hydroxymandelate oxidase